MYINIPDWWHSLLCLLHNKVITFVIDLYAHVGHKLNSSMFRCFDPVQVSFDNVYNHNFKMISGP